MNEVNKIYLQYRLIKKHRAFASSEDEYEWRYGIIVWAKNVFQCVGAGEGGASESQSRIMGYYKTIERARKELLLISNALNDSGLAVYALTSDD